MVRDLLIRAGIQAELEGFYLQGGVGELQATDIVRVTVPEEQAAEARQVISEWEAAEPDTPTSDIKPRSGACIAAFVVGLAFGMAGMYWFYNTPVTSAGIDYNGDGTLDEKWYYRGNRISKSETDRNRDGEIDLITHFDRHGLVDYALLDQDMDGVFETEERYRYGSPYERVTDLDGDQEPDYRAEFVFGVLNRETISSGGESDPRTVKEFGPFLQTSAKYDRDGDGRFEKIVKFNRFGQPVTN